MVTGLYVALHNYKRLGRKYYRSRSATDRTHWITAKKALYRLIRKCNRHQEKRTAAQVEMSPDLVWKTKKNQRAPALFLPSAAERQRYWTEIYTDHVLPTRLLQTIEPADPADFTDEEVQTAIARLKNKTPGTDGLTAAFLQLCGPRLLSKTAELFNHALDGPGELPTWLRTGYATQLYKGTGSRQDPRQYRILVIGSVLAKLLEKMIELRGRAHHQQGLLHISNEQAGFMPGRMAHDNLFMIHTIRDAQMRARRPLFTCKLDLVKAFDMVRHQPLLRLLTSQGAPSNWTRAVQKILTARQVSFGPFHVQLERGTAQGSPLSPLLFILFIDPLLQRLRRECKGVHFNSRLQIRCLAFADDILLLAETFGDLQNMLSVAESWAEEWDMKFSPDKCQLINLGSSFAGPMSEVPDLQLHGTCLPWVDQIKILGYTLKIRRTRITPQIENIVRGAIHRYKLALSPRNQIPLSTQLTVIKATVDCQALYTAPLHPMDYHKMDRAKTKLLCRITGCQPKDTSATFLRTELGYLPTEYEADKRALGYLHHLHSRAWFKTELTGQDTPPLYGPGPYRRLLDLASKYNIDPVPKLDKLEWKAKVADKVRQTAATDANIRLREKGLPEVQPGHRPRPYIVLGGAKSRYGLQARWEMVRNSHRTLGTKGLQEGRGHRTLCDTCHRRHHRKEDMPDLVDLIRCEALLPAHIQAYHRHVLALIRQDMHRSGSVDTSAPHIGLEKLEWPGQQATATRAACSLYKRLLRHRREQGREKGQGEEATGHGMVGR